MEKRPGPRNSSTRLNLKDNSRPRLQDSSDGGSKHKPRDNNVSNGKLRGNDSSISSRLDLPSLPSAHSVNRIGNVRSRRFASAPGEAVESQTIVSVLILDVSMNSGLANHDWLADILGSSMAVIGLDSLNRGR